jgi:hypothetical protein
VNGEQPKKREMTQKVPQKMPLQHDITNQTNNMSVR